MPRMFSIILAAVLINKYRASQHGSHLVYLGSEKEQLIKIHITR